MWLQGKRNHFSFVSDTSPHLSRYLCTYVI
jgi:hypothetical protein